MHGENRTCSHPRPLTGDATTEKNCRQKLREIQRAELFATKYKLVMLPVQGGLHMLFSPGAAAGDVTFSKNHITIASKKLLM